MLELNYTLYTSFPLILWDYRIIVASFRYCHFSHPVGTNINQVIIALSIPYHNWFPRLTKLLSSLMKTLWRYIYKYIYIFPFIPNNANTDRMIQWANPNFSHSNPFQKCFTNLSTPRIPSPSSLFLLLPFSLRKFLRQPRGGNAVPEELFRLRAEGLCTRRVQDA